jgi:hypothetical protein
MISGRRVRTLRFAAPVAAECDHCLTGAGSNEPSRTAAIVGDLSELISSNLADGNRSDAPCDPAELDDRTGVVAWHSSPMTGVLSQQTQTSDLSTGEGPMSRCQEVAVGRGRDPAGSPTCAFTASRRLPMRHWTINERGYKRRGPSLYRRLLAQLADRTTALTQRKPVRCRPTCRCPVKPYGVVMMSRIMICAGLVPAQTTYDYISVPAYGRFVSAGVPVDCEITGPRAAHVPPRAEGER